VSSTNINKVIAFLGFYDFARAAILKNNREKKLLNDARVASSGFGV